MATMADPIIGWDTYGYWNLIKMYVKAAENDMIVPLPSNIMIDPIMVAEENLPACLITKQNESQAALQKLLLWRAI